MPHSTGSSNQRIVSIDVIRGFALASMVSVHFVIFFGNAQAVHTWIYFGMNHVMGDWIASCFLMLSGISQVLSGQHHAELDNRLLFKRALIRGTFIFGAGLVMLALAWGPAHIWQWDILTLMGVATVVLFFCRFLPSWSIVLITVFIAACTPFLRGLLAIAPAWSETFMPVPVINDYFPGLLYDPVEAPEAAWNITDIVRGFFFTGDFPVFPWILFPLLGFVLGRRLVENKLRKDVFVLAPFGVGFILLGLGIGYAGSQRPVAAIISGYIAPLSFYPNSFPMVFFQLGVSVTIIAILYYFYDIFGCRCAQPGVFARIFMFLSRSSLTFYFSHYMIIGWTLAAVYCVTGAYRLYDLMGAWPAFLCSFAAMAVLYHGLRIWDKRGGKYKLEWFLNELTRR